MTAPSSVDPARFLHDQLAGVAGSVTTDADHLHQRSDVRGGGRDLRHPRTASRSRSGPSCATATGTGSSTPAPAASTWRSEKLREGSYIPDRLG
jgi:hypothetical protein